MLHLCSLIISACIGLVSGFGNEDCPDLTWHYLPNEDICYKAFHDAGRSFKNARGFCKRIAARTDPQRFASVSGSLLSVSNADAVLQDMSARKDNPKGLFRIEGYQGVLNGQIRWLQFNKELITHNLDHVLRQRRRGRTLAVKPLTGEWFGHKDKCEKMSYICQVDPYLATTTIITTTTATTYRPCTDGPTTEAIPTTTMPTTTQDKCLSMSSTQAVTGIQYWEQCFLDNPLISTKEYADIYHIIQTIREARLLHNIQGTGFLFDATENNTAKFQFQKDLASLIAISTDTNVEDCSSPIVHVNFYHRAASSSLQCLSTCAADNSLQWRSPNPQKNPDTLSTACTHANYIIEHPKSSLYCKRGYTHRRMALAFINSKSTDYPSNCFKWFPTPDNVRLAIRINGEPVHLDYPSAPEYDLPIPYNTIYAKAAVDLLQCTRKQFCGIESNRDDIGTNKGGIRYHQDHDWDAAQDRGMDEYEEVYVGPDGVVHHGNETLERQEVGP